MPNLQPGFVDLHDAVPGIEVDFNAYRACEREHPSPPRSSRLATK